MSDPEQALSNAIDVEACAADWLERRVSDEWSKEDDAALEAWLAQSPAHSVAYWRLKAAWGRAHRLSVLGTVAPDAAPASPRVLWPTVLKLAAGFAVAALIGVGAANIVMQPHERTYSTPVGGHEVISFTDGSRIELNTDTVLRARMTTDQRVVWLDKGEAYFQVKHDPAHPFVVMAGNHRVTDLGTKFVVRRGAAKLQVAVMQGRVTFDATDAQGTAQFALLTPGEMATATANKISVQRVPQKRLMLDLSWRHDALVFDNTRLADAAAEFNRYNQRKLVIADPAVGELKIYGTFRADNVTDFTQLTEAVFGLRVVTKENRILLSR